MTIFSSARRPGRRWLPAAVAVAVLGLTGGGWAAQAGAAPRAAAADLPSECTISGATPSLTAHPTGVALWKLSGGARLDLGQYCQTGLGGIRMQTNGNLVAYNEVGKTLWYSATRGRGHHAIMQGDGNLVIYNSGNSPVWSTYSSTSTPGRFLAVQADGNVVLYDASWGTYFATFTNHYAGGNPPTP